MKRGHVPRRAAQVANFGLFLLIIGVCGYLAWRVSQFQAFVVPEGYIAGYVEEGGLLWKKKRVRAFSAGTHPVLHNEEAARSPAYRTGQHSFAFDAAAKVDVALWKDARNLLTRGQAPIIRVLGEIEASVTEETVEALLLSGEPIDEAMRDSVAQVLAKSARENATSKEALEMALLDGLEETLTGQIHLKVDRIQIEGVSEVDSISPAAIGLPPDFVVETEIVNETPPEAYATVFLAVLLGAFFFLVMRLLFADLIALIILTPFHWMGLVEDVHWRAPEEEERAREGESAVLDVIPDPFPLFSHSTSDPPPAEPGPVVGPTIDAGPAPEVPGVLADGLGAGAEIPGEIAGGAAEAATETAAMATEALGGLAEGVGGCAEGCLGGIFG